MAKWEELVSRFGYNLWRIHLLFFQTTGTGEPKGIVAIDLGEWK